MAKLVSVDEDIYDVLKKIKRETGTPMGRTIRRLVNEYITVDEDWFLEDVEMLYTQLVGKGQLERFNECIDDNITTDLMAVEFGIPEKFVRAIIKYKILPDYLEKIADAESQVVELCKKYDSIRVLYKIAV